MSVQPLSIPSDASQVERLKLVCFALCVASLAYLAVLLSDGGWILDAAGRPMNTDFIAVFAAGRMALDGHPAGAYDPNLHMAMEAAITGSPIVGYNSWPYPPPFMMVAALLAMLPYPAAFLAWMAITLPLYLATIRTIIGERIGWLMALAFPGLVPSLVPGQNGFFSAALIGGTLVLLERHPVLAGVCLGILTYKPHYGILFPLVLAAGGRWTAMVSAAVTGLALALAACLAFGIGPWLAFLEWLPKNSEMLFSDGGVPWFNLQSAFALVRLLGGGETLAWSVHLALVATVAVVLCLMWRNPRIAFDLKAAALATGAMVSTPYSFIYDVPVLAVALAFLLRGVGTRAVPRVEWQALAAVIALLIVLPFLRIPVILPASAIIAALIVRRIFESRAPHPETREPEPGSTGTAC
jgi:arabinofuranan 3-O-arabinosyltransferase